MDADVFAELNKGKKAFIFAGRNAGMIGYIRKPNFNFLGKDVNYFVFDAIGLGEILCRVEWVKILDDNKPLPLPG